MFNRYRQTVKQLKRETLALYLAYKDPRVPLIAKVIVMVIVAYALSPIDLIPDPIPVLGQLDDLILIPLGIALALRLIPSEVMDDCRQRADEIFKDGKPTNRFVGALIIGIWIVVIVGGISYGVRLASV